MFKKSSGKPRSSRDREFNLIWFVDAARTRSVKARLLTVQIIAGVAAVIVLWAFTSIFIIASLEHDRQRLSAELRGTLATLFSYQTRFDDVYALAYPDSERSSKPRPTETVTTQPSTEIAATTKSPEPPAPAASEKSTPAPKPVVQPVSPQQPAIATTKSESGQPDEGWDDAEGASETSASRNGQETPIKFAGTPPAIPDVNVVVENPTIVAGESNTEFLFDIRNTVATDKAQGLIWAVATFDTEGGKRTFVGVPKGIRVGADGAALNPDRGHRFGIMRFRRKSFLFNHPPQFKGKLTGIRLFVKGRQGDGMMEYQTTLDLPIGPKGAVRTTAPQVEPKQG